ncbi:MAG: hypothetical protein AAF637_17165 [Pseudomonadota bacterium]
MEVRVEAADGANVGAIIAKADAISTVSNSIAGGVPVALSVMPV